MRKVKLKHIKRILRCVKREIKQMLSVVNIGMILITLLTSLLLVSCADISHVIYRGTGDDMFVETSIKKVNIPLWVEFAGLVLYLITLCCSTVSRTIIIKYRPNVDNVKIPIKILLLLKVMIFISVATMTFLFGFLAITMEILDSDTMFKMLLTLQIAFLLLAALSATIRFGNNLELLGIKSNWFKSLTEFSKSISNRINKTVNSTIEKEKEGKE